MAKASFQVWDMRTRANIFTLTGHTSTVGDVKTQDSDPQIISGSMDSTVRFVYSLETLSSCSFTEYMLQAMGSCGWQMHEHSHSPQEVCSCPCDPSDGVQLC